MEEQNKLEKMAGNLGTGIAATLIAAFSGTPVAALLPMLTNTLASGRHKKRVENAIKQISSDLKMLEDKMEKIGDQQYKLINDAILTVFQTTEDQKIEYLRNVVKNSIALGSITDHEASLISRIIRDMSASEAAFLVEKTSYERISFGESKAFDDRSYEVNPTSKEGLVVNGLINLGILTPGEPTNTMSVLLKFAPITDKVIELLASKEPNH